MYVTFYLLNASWNFDLQVSVFGSKFNDFSLKNCGFVSEVDFLLIEFLYCSTMIDGLFEVCDLLFKMLVVRIGHQCVFLLLCFEFVAIDFFFHLVNDCFDGFVCDGVKFLTDVFDADLIQHFGDQELGLFIFLLFFLFGFLVGVFLLGWWLLLDVLELLWKCLNFLILLILGGFGVLLFLIQKWAVWLDGFGSLWFFDAGTLLSFWEGRLEVFWFFLWLGCEIWLILSFFLNWNEWWQLLLLLVVHWSDFFE